MKVLHVIPNISPRYGGSALVCREYCRVLAKAGIDTTIYTTNLDYPAGRMQVPTGQPLDVEGVKTWHFSAQFRPYALSFGLARALLRHAKDFDLIHIHGLYRFPHAAAAIVAQKFKIPYLISPHGSLDPVLYHSQRHRRLKRLYERVITFPNFKKAAGLHFTTDEEMNLAGAFIPRVRNFVVPFGLDLKNYSHLPERGLFRQKHQLGNSKIILYLGRIHFVKGLDLLIKAFSIIVKNQSDVRLVLAGPDNDGYRKTVDEWVKRERLEEKVLFTDMLYGSDVLEAYCDADVFALPSYSESFGISVVEAMACGLPVVISNKVKLWRHVDHFGTGLVTACDSVEIAEALQSLLGDENRRKAMGQAGKELVKSLYGLESVANQLLDSYKEIIGIPVEKVTPNQSAQSAQFRC